MAGVYAAFERIRHTEVSSSAGSSPRRTCCIAGASPSSAPNVKKDLFSGMPAVDAEIKIDGVRFTVIGVLRKKTQITNYTAPG